MLWLSRALNQQRPICLSNSQTESSSLTLGTGLIRPFWLPSTSCSATRFTGPILPIYFVDSLKNHDPFRLAARDPYADMYTGTTNDSLPSTLSPFHPSSPRNEERGRHAPSAQTLFICPVSTALVLCMVHGLMLSTSLVCIGPRFTYLGRYLPVSRRAHRV